MEASTLAWALPNLSHKGSEGLEIIKSILEKFKDREELFQVDKNGVTALTWALDRLSDKGPEGLKIIKTILQKFLDRPELFQATLSMKQH